MSVRMSSVVLFLMLQGLLALSGPDGAPGAPPHTPPATPFATSAPDTLAAPQREYRLFVGSEATDLISVVVFGPAGARVEREFTVGIFFNDLDAPHGLAMSPTGDALYVTTGHGRPWGSLWKLDPESGRVLGRVELGLFPASLELSPDGAFAYVVNFNLHGDMVPSSVSIVATGPMVEVSRLTTCTMPHGSRLDPLGSRQYSTCMMDDLLVEVDAWDLSVGRHFMLAPGREHGMAGAPHQGPDAHGGAVGATLPDPASMPPSPPDSAHGEHQGHGGASSDPAHAVPPAECSPTWAQPSADGSTVFVACNRSNEIVEVWVEDWTLKRRLPAGDGVYNLAVTRDGSLLVGTNKRGGSVSIFDAVSGEELARVPTARTVVHGVVLSPDDRYAFVSVEGVGSEPGTVEIIDLAERRVAARVDVPQMAGGIAFWK